MNSNEHFECKAEAFYRMTGLMAPGKDPGRVASNNPEVRYAVWDVWCKAYGEAVNAGIKAVEIVMMGGEK